MILFAIGILVGILALICIIWSIKEPKNMEALSDKWHDTSNHGLSRFIFIFSSFLALLLFVASIASWISKSEAVNGYEA